MPCPVFEETPETGTSPPRPSNKTPASDNSFFTFSKLAPCLSILVIAVTKGICASSISFNDSLVWGFTPSSAATTKIATSATFAPRERILENASWPGVSIKVIFLPSTSIS